MEALALDGIRRLPAEEHRRVLELIVAAGSSATPPRRVTATHSLVLDLQETVLPIEAEGLDEGDEALLWAVGYSGVY